MLKHLKRRGTMVNILVSGTLAMIGTPVDPTPTPTPTPTVTQTVTPSPTSTPTTDPSVACGPTGNAISCENSKPGSDDWDISGAGDDSIQGFSTDISVNVGQRIDFKIDTDASAYTIEIFRIGYYQGKGARKVATVNPSAPLPQRQPNCISDLSTELYDCGNWAVSASWNVPNTAVSGVHVAKLTRSNGGSSHITFVVRNDASTSDVVFQTSDPTWQAYNTYGGSDFYQGGANGRAYKISYNRPVLTRDGIGGRDFFFSNEYPMVRFLERNGYDTSYIAGVDTDRRGHLLTNHKTFLSVGHDEYWSGAQRANVEAARDAGVHLQFLSGNEVYWRTRYEPSVDASRTPYRTLVSYKETWGNAKIDPSDQWTGTWRDPRFASTSKGAGRPENGLTGTAYMVNYSDLAMKVSATEGKYRLWRHTSLASMSSGTATLAPHTVGYESNEDLDNGHRPEGLVRLSTTTGEVPEYLQDYGNQVAPGTTTHHVTLYKAASGALVFSAGTVQWTWGLDEDHDSPFPSEPADPRMQQAQVNLFADMGVQPTTLQPSLTKATKSTDTTRPTVTITSPAAGAAQANGTKVTLTGTAADVGGRVAGVEVSTDGGTTWRPATGTTSWTYSYIQHGRGSSEVRVRAVDDSANIGTPTTRSFTVSCPCSLFGQTVPPVASTPDTTQVELGIRFTPTTDGFVSGIRFHKGEGNTGSHVGSLWTEDGERLSQVAFTDETATGWQTATFAVPVQVRSGRTYVASYSAPAGRYSSQPQAFTSFGHDAKLLKVAGGFEAEPAGVYGTMGTFPTNSWQRTNYFVDVAFNTAEDLPLGITDQSPAVDAVTVPVGTKVSGTFSKAVTPGSVRATLRNAAGTTVSGTTVYNATTRTVTFTPSSALADFALYSVTIEATASVGGSVTSGGQWSFRTARPSNPPGVCPCSLFDEDTVPALLEDSDTVPVTLGTRFTSDVDGRVTGVRFYKGPGNTGTHTGSLWSAGGSLLATGTFTGEAPSGWQDLEFDEPVTITRNTEYVVSYRAPVGRYSATPNAFVSSDLSRAPLRVRPDSGAYTYGTGFPDQRSGSSYLVDVVLERTPPALELVTQAPAPGAVDVPANGQVTVEFSTALADGWSLTARRNGATVAGTARRSSDGTRLTWTSSQALPAGAQMTLTASGLAASEGNATLPNQTWTFRVAAPGDTQAQSLFGDQVPATLTTDEAVTVELGSVFTPSRDGTVTAIRFFKGPGNTGTHTGSVWSMGGSRLATVTFSDETATGWQTATLAEPLQVVAGTSYVVSYLAPQGRYSTSPGFFSQAWTRGDLTAPASGNGRYVYGGGFPEYSFGAANYFVDVVFARDLPSLTAQNRSPEPDGTGVSLDAKPSLRVSAPLADGWTISLKRGTTDVPGSAALSADRRQVTFTPGEELDPETLYTVTVSGLTSQDGAPLAAQTWSFTTREEAAEDQSTLFGFRTPANPFTDDGGAIEVGTKFTPSVDGTVTGIRFYKGPGNIGTHTGSLWTSGGSRLAQVTFTGETSTGWQSATLDTPVDVDAGVTYVVSYHAPNGHYASEGGFFDLPWIAGPLTSPTGENGLYQYGPGAFPTNSWNATNYFVDVNFRPR